MASYPGVEVSNGTVDRVYTHVDQAPVGVSVAPSALSRVYTHVDQAPVGVSVTSSALSRVYTHVDQAPVGAATPITTVSDNTLVRNTAYPGDEVSNGLADSVYSHTDQAPVGIEAANSLFNRSHIHVDAALTGIEASNAVVDAIYNHVDQAPVGIEVLSSGSSLIYGTATHRPTAVLRGYVTDLQNVGIGSALIEVLKSNGTVEQSTQTQADGLYDLDIKSDKTRTIRASKSGYTTDSRPSVTFGSADITNHDYTLATKYTVDGTVQDEGGSGIGSANLVASANTVRSNDRAHWHTTSDWDNAVSQSGVSHSGDTIKLSVNQIDDFDSYSTGSPPPDWTVYKSNGNVVSTRGYSDGQSWGWTTNIADPGGTVAVLADRSITADQYDTYQWTYYETTNNNAIGMRLLDSGGNTITAFGTGNPAVHYYDGQTDTTLINPSNPQYGAWRRITLTFDWANNQFDLLWEDLTGNESNQSASNVAFYHSSASDIATPQAVVDDRSWGSGGGLDAWYDDTGYKGSSDSGSLTTATKSFTDPVEPDLRNVRYTLNGGSIDVTVIGSPGTTSEERVTQTLNGATKYDLSWTNSHTDFRAKIDMSDTTDPRATFSSVELKPIIHHQTN